ncbi:ABATE domain-containing protein [Micromonospora sp. WMMD1102]|uniref:CGNR zinc finger domain-containing protein n=1 Tax=Micromonospora sp. WMMD1102 TaxID=3016105 RepID=UPI0024158CE9|nr:ABATE domain-containing protein [Micromonospora sp. WMMD1102]MDG4789095.1 ABATE domain-containing protein [Micromonospora sp. WMMD1102]
MAQQLMLALTGTIRHDGNGGVADDLADVAGLTAWLEAQAEALTEYAGGLGAVAEWVDEPLRLDVVALRRAVRTLFARAVRPAPPSRADSSTLLDPRDAVDQLNRAAGRWPVRPVLSWPDGAGPVVGWSGGPADARIRLLAGLARAAIEFLAGPDRERLAACPAPRCVRYFLKGHPRQEWCKASCGNRARVSRHYRRRTADQPG